MADTTKVTHELLDDAGGRLYLDGDQIKTAGWLPAGPLTARLRTTTVQDYDQTISIPVGVGGFEIDFVARRARRAGVLAPIDKMVWCARASGAKALDGGTWRDYGANAWRYGSDGLLIEPARTNEIRNSTMVGGVAPSTPPQFWTASANNGVVVTNYAYGTEAGLKYVDITFGGTASAGASGRIDAESLIRVSPGDEFYYSAYLATSKNADRLWNLMTAIRFGDAKGLLVSVPNYPGGPDIRDRLTATMAPHGHFLRLAEPTAMWASPRIQLSFKDGAVDFTLRVGAPQFERGQLPTSPIDTSGAAAARAADAVTIAIPAGTHNLAITYADGFVRQIAGVSGNYTLPVDQNRPIIKNIVGARA